MELKNKNILVVGLGKSGVSAKRLLEKNRAKVFCYDDILFPNKPLSKAFDFLDFVVVSPGVPSNNLMIKNLESRNFRLISEIEFAFNFEKGSVIAITGTNGKTTTVSLLYHILKKHAKTFLAGNVGTPYSDVVTKTKNNSISVLEVSNFQLERIEKFKPCISAILNLAPDHLDRYNTFEDYINAKKNIFKNQTEKDYCVLNYNDEIIKTFESEIKAKKIFFSSNDESENKNFIGACIKNGAIFFCGEEILKRENIKLIGEKNLENVLACVCVCKILKIPNEIIKSQVENFMPLENRLEIVCKNENITVINDSKATNVASAIADISAVYGDKVLILGGSEKNEDFDKLNEILNNEIKYIFVYGETKDKIIKSLLKYNFNSFKICQNFEDAVKNSYNYCKNISERINLLLSPACASFDEFENYKKRGEKFKEIIKKLNKNK